MTVLGISLGTQRTGVCVLDNGTIVERQIHSYLDIWSETKLHTIVSMYKRYIRKHEVTAIIVKIPSPHNHTQAITDLLGRIERLARRYNCQFDLITKSEIKHVLCLSNTTEMNTFAKLLYPELASVYNKGEANGHNYFKKLFEAVLAAHIYQGRLKK